MKLFQKRRDTVEIDDERLSDFVPPSEQIHYDAEGNHFEQEEFVRQTSDYSPKRQSIGVLVRKLNCASSKKHDDYDYDGMYHDLGGRGETDVYGESNSIASPPRKAASIFSKAPKPEITRPVLITVKNGDVKEQLPASESNDQTNYQHENNGLGNSFIVGEIPPPTKMCTSASFKLGMSARKRVQNASKYFKHKDNEHDMDRNWNNGNGFVMEEWQQNNMAEDCKEDEHVELDPRRAAQEAARKERWKRGLEMESRVAKGTKPWPKFSPGRDKDGDDSLDDSITTGSNTTGSTTGYDTAEDSSTMDDSWTDATDDSGVKQYNYYNYPGQCANGQQVVASVAEDFGIFAQLLFSDGVACLGTAAAITKETVGNCHDKRSDKRSDRRNEDRTENRRERPARRSTQKTGNGRRWRNRKQV